MPPAERVVEDHAVKNTTLPGRFPIESTVTDKLLSLDVRPGDIAAKYSQQDRSITIQAAVPRGKPFEWVIGQLSGAVDGSTYRVSDCVADDKKSSCTIIFSPVSKRDPQATLVLTMSDRYQQGAAEIAFLVEGLEDTAYQIAVGVLSFQEPLTVALPPGGKKAPLIAQLAEQYRKEIAVRLPLEPAGKVPGDFEKTAILVQLPEPAVHAIINEACRIIPGAKGFSNLWASRCLEDSRMMTYVFEEIKKRHGYFVEALPTRNSVSSSVAQRLGVPFAGVDARIDKTLVPDIVADIKRDAATAMAKGPIVIRVTGSRHFVDALKASLPFLRQNGVRLAFVSEVVKRTQD